MESRQARVRGDAWLHRRQRRAATWFHGRGRRALALGETAARSEREGREQDASALEEKPVHECQGRMITERLKHRLSDFGLIGARGISSQHRGNDHAAFLCHARRGGQSRAFSIRNVNA